MDDIGLQPPRMIHEGTKHDAGKARWDLLPGDALDAVADILTMGAEKYSARNWEKGMDWGRVYGALQRHAWAWWQGEDTDPESGRSHMSHATCRALFLLAYHIRKTGEDDRPNVKDRPLPVNSNTEKDLQEK